MNNGLKVKSKTVIVCIISMLLVMPNLHAKPKVSTWMLDTCPVNPATTTYSGAGGALLALGVNKLVDFVGRAFKKAAEKDKNGVAVSDKNAAFLYQYAPEDDVAVPLNCMVIAISENDISKWFFDGNALGGNAPTITDLYNFVKRDFASQKEGNPLFYAEIMLHNSADGAGIYPQLRTLYYPKKIPGGIKAKKKRDLIIKVGAESINGKTAINTFVVHVKGIKPSPQVYKRGANGILDHGLELGSLEVWTNKADMPQKYSKPQKTALIFPINVSTEIRELSNPNVFLQWFAKYYEDNKDKLKLEEE